MSNMDVGFCVVVGAPLEVLARRRPWLVLGVVGVVLDAADAELGESELAELFGDVPWSTVARVLRELAAAGVVHRVGGRRDRRWRVTPLGRAWVEREVAPWPWPDGE